MDNLQDKLRQFGFPEPDSIRNRTGGYFSEQTACYDLSHGSFEIVFEPKPNSYELYLYADAEVYGESSSELAEYKQLKTDADWQAVAGFLRFLKGAK